MAERALEADLEAWFADSPPLPDAAVFAGRVTGRLERDWTLRRVLIGGLGLIGGLVGGAQVLGSGLIGRLPTVEAQSASVSHTLATRLQDSSLVQTPFVHDTLARLSELGGGNAEALWMSVAMALFAAGLLVTRAIREL
jgi:hypothetical protein